MKDSFDRIQQAFAEALVEASDNFQAAVEQKSTTEDGGVEEIKNSVRRTHKMPLKDQLSAYYKNQFKRSDAFYFGITPSILSKSGLNAHPLAFAQDDFVKSTRGKHNIPRRVLNKLSEKLPKPIFSFTAGQQAGIVIDDIDGDGKPVVVAIHGGHNMDRKPVNLIKSIYGIDSIKKWVAQQIEGGCKFRVYDKEKANAMLQTEGYLAEVGTQSDGSWDTISRIDPNVKSESSVKKSDRNPALAAKINESLTMQEAKQMIQRAFIIGNIKEWYDDEYQNGDEWLAAQGAEEVAMYIENEYTLQAAYLDKIPGLLDEEFFLTDVLEAYQQGTLTGKVKKKTERINIADSVAVADPRFYAPKEIENAKEQYGIANQRITNGNREAVNRARAQILLYAHNKGAAETLGITQSELNKKLRTWGGYSAKARDISMRINAGVHATNRWTGIESLSWLNKATVTSEDVLRMVKAVEGNGDRFQNNYIARTMLALDTHIDWSWLTIKFDTYEGVNKSSYFGSKCNGYYRNDGRLIHVKYDAPNTVAHEMGHALDYQWGRDIGYDYSPITEISRNTEKLSGEVLTWFNSFKDFTDSLVASSDLRSEYAMDIKETFARFVAKFVEWTEQLATGRTSSYEASYYQDKFTATQFIQFARLLQEKSAIDAKGLTQNKLGNIADGRTSAAQPDGAGTKNSSRNSKWKPNLDNTEWGIVNYIVEHNKGTAITSTCNMFFEKSKGRTLFGIYSTEDSTLLYAAREQTAEKEHIFVDFLREEYKNGNVTDTSAEGLRAWAKAVWMQRTASDYHGAGNVAPGRSAGDVGLHGGSFRLYASTALRNVLANIFQKGTAGRAGVKNSERSGDSVSNRTLLANAFEGLSRNSDEYAMIQRYRNRIRLLEEQEEKLAKINAEIHEIRFTKGKYDAGKLAELEAKKQEISKEITRHDKKLLEMEVSAPFRKVIEQERKKEAQRTKAHVAEVQQNKKLRAEQTELRHKVRKVIRDLDKILRRGNKQRLSTAPCRDSFHRLQRKLSGQLKKGILQYLLQAYVHRFGDTVIKKSHNRLQT